MGEKLKKSSVRNYSNNFLKNDNIFKIIEAKINFKNCSKTKKWKNKTNTYWEKNKSRNKMKNFKKRRNIPKQNWKFLKNNYFKSKIKINCKSVK